MGAVEFHRGPSGRILPGLSCTWHEALARLLRLVPREQVSLVYLFGSYARQAESVHSDLDLAVRFELSGEELYLAYRRLMLAVQEQLGSERIDLLLLNGAPLTMQFEVIRSGQLLYARDEDLVNSFEMTVISKYQDTAYLRAVQNEYLKERARRWYSEKQVF